VRGHAEHRALCLDWDHAGHSLVVAIEIHDYDPAWRDLA
jgi:hypothetical protein